MHLASSFSLSMPLILRVLLTSGLLSGLMVGCDSADKPGHAIADVGNEGEDAGIEDVGTDAQLDSGGLEDTSPSDVQEDVGEDTGPEDDWSGYRSLPIVCGSIDEVVVAPSFVRVTASVLLGGDYCSTILQLGQTGGNSFFIRAIPTADNVPGCSDSVQYAEITIRDLAPGDYSVSMRGVDDILFRKVVTVLPEGEGEAVRSETCMGKEDFVGTCGVELFCDFPMVCEDGVCAEVEPGPVMGSYQVRVRNVRQGCMNENDEPVDGIISLPEVLTVHIDQEPDQLMQAVATLDGYAIFGHENAPIPGNMHGNRFVTFAPGNAEMQVGHGCFNIYSFFLEATIYPEVGLSGTLTIPHAQRAVPPDGYCSNGNLDCDFAADLVPVVEE